MFSSALPSRLASRKRAFCEPQEFGNLFRYPGNERVPGRAHSSDGFHPKQAQLFGFFFNGFHLLFIQIHGAALCDREPAVVVKPAFLL
jgi:hypothetical protein